MVDVIREFADNFRDDAVEAFRAHPVEILLGVALAALFSFEVAAGVHTSERKFTWALMVVTPLMVLSVFSISSLHRMNAIGGFARRGLTAAILVAGVSYAWWLRVTVGFTEGWRFATLATSIASAATLVPLAASDYSARRAVRFWRFNARLVVRVFVSGLYLGLLFVGLCIGLTAIRWMFETAFPPELYAHLAGWLFFGAGPWMVLAASDDIHDLYRAIPQGAVRWIARLGSYLFLPLLVLYLLITYTYGLRVAFTDFAPSNVISPMVLGAGIMGFLGLYLVEPLRHRDDYGLLSKLFHFFPVAFVVVLPLSFWAVLERVFQYGWTEFRYLRFLAILLFAGLCIYGGIQLVRRRSMPLYSVPMVVAIGLLFAAAGPGSVVQVSKASQLDRLVTAAEQGGALEDGIIDVDSLEAVPEEHQSEIGESASYLKGFHSVDSMAHLAAPDADLDAVVDEMTSLDTGRYGTHRGPGRGSVQNTGDHAPAAGTIRLRSDGPWPVEHLGTRYPLAFNTVISSNRLDLGDREEADMQLEGSILSIHARDAGFDTDCHGDFEPLLDHIANHGYEEKMTADLPSRFHIAEVRDDTGREVGAIMLEDIVVDTRSDTPTIERIDGDLLLADDGR